MRKHDCMRVRLYTKVLAYVELCWLNQLPFPANCGIPPCIHSCNPAEPFHFIISLNGTRWWLANHTLQNLRLARSVPFPPFLFHDLLWPWYSITLVDTNPDSLAKRACKHYFWRWWWVRFLNFNHVFADANVMLSCGKSKPWEWEMVDE